MKKESEKDSVKRRMAEMNNVPANERFVICGTCKNNYVTNEETCSMCASCISGSNYAPMANGKDNCSCDCGSCPDRFVNDRALTETSCPAEKRPAATPEPDQTKDPKARYYDAGGIEVLDVIKAKLTPDQYKGWLLGNLIKYSCRANFKDQLLRDIEKVAFYSAEMFKTLEA